MNFFVSLIRGHRAPFFAGLIGLIYLLLVGFRGFGASGLQWLQRSRKLAMEFADSPSSVMEFSGSPPALIDLFGAFVYVATPGGTSEWALFGLSVLCGAIAMALIFYLSSRLAGALGGWISLLFLLTCAPWMGIFTRIDPTFLVVPVMLAVICIWHAPDLKWWKKPLFCTPLLAVSTLLWTGTALVLAILLTVELLAAPIRYKASEKGLFDGPALEIDRLITPVLTVGLLLLYPLFWPAPVESLIQYFLAALETPPTEFVFRGNAYPPARPPVYTGIAWVFEQLPLAMVFAFVGGILWFLFGARTEHSRLAMTCAGVAAAILAMPVLFRGPRPLDAEFGVLFIAVVTPVASFIVCRFFTHALGRNAPSPKVRQIAIITFLLGGISILIEAPRAMESPETYRSPMTARLVGWSASGDSPLREDILPLRIIEMTGADRNAPLYVGGWEDYLDVYRRMRLLNNIETTTDSDLAYAAIRRVPPVVADPYNSYSTAYLPALPNSTTVLVPDIHRPAFFIDIATSNK